MRTAKTHAPAFQPFFKYAKLRMVAAQKLLEECPEGSE